MNHELVDIISKICQKNHKGEYVGLHEPDFKDTSAWEYVKECIDSGWVSSAGEWVNKIERHICEITGAREAVAVTNGTVALRLALHVVGVKPGEEVIMPSMSFVATANAASHLGAYPHFVDIEEKTLGLSPYALRKRLQEIGKIKDSSVINQKTNRRIAAIVPVHVFGHPAQMKEIMEVSMEWGIPIVEDAAEALGSHLNSTHCGLFGEVGCISFNGNKLITTGGGGALMSNNVKLSRLAKHLSTTAKVKHQWEFRHDYIGWNDRMPNINAALGVAQLEKIKDKLKAKRELLHIYEEKLSTIKDIEIIHEPEGSVSNYWLITIRLLEGNLVEVEKKRNQILQASHEKGLQLRPVWQPLHQQLIYSSNEHGDLNVTNEQSLRLISLPSSPQLIQ